MSEAFYEKEKELKSKISLDSDSGFKLIEVNDYINSNYRRFKKIINEVNNENDAKLLFLDFIELKNNVDEVYLTGVDMDDYMIEKINNAYDILASIYALILSKSPNLYSSQIQYFAYSSLFSDKDQLIFYNHLFSHLKDNIMASRYLIGVFKEIIFVHYDLDINDNIKNNIIELIDLLKTLCDEAGLDQAEELEGLIN